MKSRVTDRRGLFNMDGDKINKPTIIAAYNGSVMDMDILRLSINDAIISILTPYLSRLSVEFCLASGRWPPNPRLEASMYADCILADWRMLGDATITSLYDTMLLHIDYLRNVCLNLPTRNFIPKNFTHDDKHAYTPVSIFPPKRQKEYLFKENDYVYDLDSPLLLHMIEKKCKIIKNNVIDGDKRHDVCDNNLLIKQSTSKQTVRHFKQNEKVTEIKNMIKTIKPISAFMSDNFGRCSVLLQIQKSEFNLPHIWNFVDHIESKYNTPFDCLVIDDESFSGLLADSFYNDAKRIIANGHNIVGDKIDVCEASMSLLSISEDDMLYNFEKYGFELFNDGNMGPHNIHLGPEYLIAAAYFKTEPRMYITGVAAILYKNIINWPLLLYLAKTYGFLRSMLGIITELLKYDKNFSEPINLLSRYGCKPIDTEQCTIYDMVRIYG